MPTTFVTGDLLQARGLEALAHGCNCAGAMGKGIAVEFRERFPKMYAEYKARCADGRFQLGDVFAWTEGGITIFNLGTQKTWRTKAEMSAIESALAKMIREAEARGISHVGLPRIGAGLGGLPWDRVKGLLTEVGKRTGVHLTVFETYAPNPSPPEGPESQDVSPKPRDAFRESAARVMELHDETLRKLR